MAAETGQAGQASPSLPHPVLGRCEVEPEPLKSCPTVQLNQELEEQLQWSRNQVRRHDRIDPALDLAMLAEGIKGFLSWSVLSARRALHAGQRRQQDWMWF